MPDQDAQATNPSDIFLWPNDTCPYGGTRCYRCEYERGEYAQMPDGFEIVPAHTPRWYRLEAEADTSIDSGDVA